MAFGLDGHCVSEPGRGWARRIVAGLQFLVNHQNGLVFCIGGREASFVGQGHTVAAVAAPRFKDKPFGFLELTIDEAGEVTVEEHRLCLPAELGLFDYHVHTRFAYCSDGSMDFADTVRLAEMFNLKGFSFTEHSRHLYYPREALRLPVIDRREENRVDEFLREVAAYRGTNILAGVELDPSFTGQPTMRAEEIERFDIVLGGVHRLPKLSFEDMYVAESNLKGMLLNFLEFPVDVLAHPLRVMWKGQSGGGHVSRDFCGWLAKYLKQKNVAAGLNFHGNNPDPQFFQICLEEGVKIALGSDAHSLCDVGSFHPHLEFLRTLGCSGDLTDVLLTR
mgnify:CR=1 FL=1